MGSTCCRGVRFEILQQRQWLRDDGALHLRGRVPESVLHAPVHQLPLLRLRRVALRRMSSVFWIVAILVAVPMSAGSLPNLTPSSLVTATGLRVTGLASSASVPCRPSYRASAQKLPSAWHGLLVLGSTAVWRI